MKNNSSKRIVCDRCKRPIANCYCDCLETIETQGKILIIRHVKEREHPFNTALMARLQIKNLVLLDSDNPNFKEILLKFIEDNNPILIFKNTKSKNITDQKFNSQQSFILLDGTWDKARSLLLGNSEVLEKLETFHFDVGSTPQTIYHSVRKACSNEALSTLEALVYTLEYLNEKNYQKLLRPLERIIEDQKKWAKKGP